MQPTFHSISLYIARRKYLLLKHHRKKCFGQKSLMLANLSERVCTKTKIKLLRIL